MTTGAVTVNAFLAGGLGAGSAPSEECEEQSSLA
jgi:hypothetical protein